MTIGDVLLTWMITAWLILAFLAMPYGVYGLSKKIGELWKKIKKGLQ